MVHAAKVMIVDDNGHYLLLTRNKHPHFGNDPDLPGGTVERGESALDGAVREVYEEVGINVDPASLELIYDDNKYSLHFSRYTLYKVTLTSRPNIVLSWEHSSYEWVQKNEFIQKTAAARDTFMRMVSENT